MECQTETWPLSEACGHARGAVLQPVSARTEFLDSSLGPKPKALRTQHRTVLNPKQGSGSRVALETALQRSSQRVQAWIVQQPSKNLKHDRSRQVDLFKYRGLKHVEMTL